MGIAKYYEDNNEITNERQRDKLNKKENSKTNNTNSTPLETVKYPDSDTSKIYNQKESVQSSQIENTTVYKNSDQNEHPKASVEERAKTTKPSKKKKYKDKILVCQRCGKRFMFRASTQKQFDKKGWKEPKRCKSCRDYINISYLMRHSR